MFSQGQEIVLSVPSVKEIEAPLGGKTTVYNIVIKEGNNTFNVGKTFWEFEDLAKRLQKKYQNLSFPTLKTSPESNVRCQAADQFVKFIASHSDVITDHAIKQFMGIDSEANYQINPVAMKKQTEADEPDNPIFKTSTQTTKVIERETEKNDLLTEFENSSKVLNQQNGKTSFFDFDDEESDDEDLFKVTKPNAIKPKNDEPKKPVAAELFESDDLKTSNPSAKLNENKISDPTESQFDESEIDDSILNLEDDLDDLKHLSVVTPKKMAAEPAKPNKPAPPPKKPSISKKPPLAPKPGAPKPKDLDEVDIGSYINSEQAASQQEAKLFD